MSDESTVAGSAWASNQDLVVKLHFQNEEIVRRICVDRLRDDQGRVCYERLVEWALRYSPMVALDPAFCGGGREWKSNWHSLRERYHVHLSYQDEDDDEIRFSSNVEFMEAIGLFAKQELDDHNADVEHLKPVVFRCSVAFDEKCEGAKSSPVQESGVNVADSLAELDKSLVAAAAAATSRPCSQGTRPPPAPNGSSWHRDCDWLDRRAMIRHILKILTSMALKFNEKKIRLPFMAKKLERLLYRAASSKAEYVNPSTVPRRLQHVARLLFASEISPARPRCHLVE